VGISVAERTGNVDDFLRMELDVHCWTHLSTLCISCCRLYVGICWDQLTAVMTVPSSKVAVSIQGYRQCIAGTGGDQVRFPVARLLLLGGNLIFPQTGSDSEWRIFSERGVRLRILTNK